MNYRLPNPSGKKWRDNFDRIFGPRIRVVEDASVAPDTIELRDDDGNLVGKIENVDTVSETADIHDMQAEEESQMEEDIRLDNAQRFRDLRR